MTKDEAQKIIHDEQLKNYNILENRSHKENELGIQYNGEKWIVYATNERAGIVTGSEFYFENEEDAWNNFIERLRAGKLLYELSNGKYQ